MSTETHDAPHPPNPVAAYYEALTEPLLYACGDLRALHFGLWGPDTVSDRESVIRSNRTLARGCDLRPGSHLLDAGCGLGGTAIALAEEHGVKVTGLTICEPHVALAADYADRRGVGHLVEFRHGDFMDMPFPDDAFEAVLNHESFCYASDKHAYLRGVFRVLKPGGQWRAIESLVSGKALSGADEADYAQLHRGCRIPPLASPGELSAALEATGFERVHTQDLGAEVAKATGQSRRLWASLQAMNLPAREKYPEYHDLMDAAVAFDRGLREGAFTYVFVSATKPA